MDTRPLVSRPARPGAQTAALVRLSGPRACRGHAVVLERVAGADARGHAPARASLGGSAMTPLTNLAPLLQRFFTQRLMQQRQASPHTISSYRDTFRHFLKFARQRLQKPPSRLTFEEIDAPLIVAFLDDREHHGLSIHSR